MADLSYQVSVDTQQAQANLTKLQNSIKTVNDTFSAFSKVLGGLAIGAFTARAVQMAAALDDVASASGMALANVVGFTQAVAANGGTTDAAAASIGRFSKFINEAAEGNKAAQSTLMELGISLNDLRTLSEQDLLRKTVEGLGQMDAGARRTALGMEIFGKAFASVDVGGVNAQLDGFIQRAGPTAAALQSAAKAEENFANALFTVQTQLLAALKPISDLAAAVTANAEAIGRWVDIIVEVAKVVATFFLVTKAIQALVWAGRALAAAPGLIVEGWAILSKTFEIIVWQIKKVIDAGAVTTKTLEGLSKRFKFLGEGLSLAAKGFGVLAAAAVAAWGALKNLFGGSEKAAENESATWDKITENRAKDIEQRKKQEEEIRKVTAAIDAETVALNKQVSAYQLSISNLTKKYELDTAMINMSERQKLLTEEMQAAESAYLQAIAPLLEEYAKKKESLNKVDQAMLPEIQKALQALTAAYEEQVGAIQRNTAARAQANEEKAIEQYTIQQMQKDYDALQKVQNDIIRGPLSEIEKKYYDIMDAADASAEAAIRAEQARRGAPLNETEIRRYYDVARQGANRLWSANKQLIEQQRTFSYGWKQAFKTYVDNATNAAKQAERMFEKFTSGLEDLIVNFAKTGKFEWKNFVASMLEELLRSQIKQTIASFFQMENPFSSSGGSIGDLFGGIFGALGGGEVGKSPNNPMYVMDVSGGGGGFFGGQGGMFPGGGIGGGGGIMGTIGNVWNGIKNVGSSIISGVGNVIGGIGGTVGKVVDTVKNIGGGLWEGIKNVGSSIASGIGSLFGGFFANGGTLPAGKFGIVGERGPEMISGPATITPMTGGTSVVYNINAVDARSFQQLLAQDPSFIFALTEQGRKSYAGAR